MVIERSVNRVHSEAQQVPGLEIRRKPASAETLLDPERIGVFGESSGGNYAAMVCTAAGSALFDDPDLGDLSYPCDVQAVIDWYGPTDLSKMDKHLEESGLGPGDHGRADSMESQYLGASPSKVPDRVRAANPITYIDERMCPILIQHGTADSVVPFQQSVEFAEAIARRVGSERYELDLLEGAVHDDPAFLTDQNFERMLRFLERWLDRPSGQRG